MEMHMPTWPTQIGCICGKLAPAAFLKTGMLFVPRVAVAQQGLTPCGKARRATPPRCSEKWCSTLQDKINKAKAMYQELLKDMQSLTEKLTAKQQKVEIIQRKLQTKLAEAECTKPEPLPDETPSFTALT